MTKLSNDPLLYPTLDDYAERDVNDHYATPEWLVKRLVSHRHLSSWLYGKTALDLGCGNGVWGKYMRHFVHDVDGIDIREVRNYNFEAGLELPVSSSNKEVYRNLFSEKDFMNNDFGGLKYDIIGFNPPFHLLSSRKTRDNFLSRLRNLTTQYGKVAFILPITYLYGLWRWDNLWSKGSLLAFYPFSDRIDWTNAGAPRKEHGMFIFQFSRSATYDLSYAKFEGNIVDTKKENL